MTKYGRRLSFGYLLLPAAADPKRPLRLAAQAETLGLDYVGVQDPRHQAPSGAMDTAGRHRHDHGPHWAGCRWD
jgi:hypothetical protein